MTKTRTRDRRKSGRLPANTCAALLVEGVTGCNQAFGAVMDISRGGIRVRTPQPPEKFDRVTVRIAVGEAVHELRCRCVRVQKVGRATYDVGLHFDPELVTASDLLAMLLPQKRD